jgi:serine phosphatase RsbU (regulator of sigma subunit)
LPLGIEEGAEFETREFSLSPGDRILACTDGAVEIPVDATNRLGVAGLVELLNEFSPRGTEHRLRPLYEELLRRCAVTAQEDDITLVSCIIR